MNGTPAGWYDDPEAPGQQRYWDGAAWTEQRSPGSAAAPTSPPPGTPPPGPVAPPPAPAPAKTSRKWLWITLSVIGVVVVLVIVAVVALVALGDDATEVVEENLPAALEANLAANGLDVTVSKVDCDDISDDDGPFTTTCQISIDGLSSPLEATVYGSVDGTTVNVDDVQSDTTLLDADLATEQTQAAIAEIDPTIDVLSCTLPETVVKVTDGLSFTCELSSDETVTLEVEDGGLTITDVQ